VVEIAVNIVVGSDHAGFVLKEQLRTFVSDLGHEIRDAGKFRQRCSKGCSSGFGDGWHGRGDRVRPIRQDVVPSVAARQCWRQWKRGSIPTRERNVHGARKWLREA
jgi:hypothetical protein